MLSDPSSGLKLVHLTPNSKATSLGASVPSKQVLERALQRPLYCVRISDEQSMHFTSQFLEDHKMMVELACGTALALGYYEPILKSVFPSITPDECIVIVVCGGVKTTLSDLVRYDGDYKNVEMRGVIVDGKCVT